MKSALDASGDTGFQEFYRISKLYGPLPDYVKQADHNDTLSPSELPAGAFADPAHDQFPCHTKSACFVSHMFFAENSGKLTRKQAAAVATRLAKSAAQYGISADVERISMKHADISKDTLASLPDSEFAIVWSGENGSKDRHYPLRNAKEAAAAADWFMTYRDDFSFADRQLIAQRILRKAAVYKAPVEPETELYLRKQAGEGIFDPTKASAELRLRVYAKSVPQEAKGQLTKLAAVVEDRADLVYDRPAVMKIAEVINDIDTTYGLTGRYGSSLSRPEDAVFSMSIKEASHLVKNACQLATGTVYSVSQFEKLAAETLADWFGIPIGDTPEMAAEKLAAAATAWPLRTAAVLDDLMQAIGESPIYEKAAGVGPTDEERTKLAKSYQL